MGHQSSLTRFNLKNMERKNFCPSGPIFAVFPTSRVWMDYSKENWVTLCTATLNTLKLIIWEKEFPEIMMQWFTVLPDGQNDGIANDPLCKFSILDDAEACACLNSVEIFSHYKIFTEWISKTVIIWCLTIIKDHLLTLF